MIDSSLKEIIHSLRPNQMLAYLASQGWREDGAIGEAASVWHRTEDENYDFEIILPLKYDLKDYVQRSYDLVNVLAKFENRSFRDVVDDLINFHADVIKIRVVHNDVENGSIPLSDGVLLVEKAKELLTSVTKSAFSKRRHFTGGVSQEVMDFVETFRLGQTEVGSYVLNLIIPVDRTPTDEQGDINEISLTRIVTHTLARSLTAIDESIANYRDTQSDLAFESAVEQGVSANLCDALVGLTGEKESRDVNITISLSRTDSECQDIPLQHSFKSNIVEYLKRASDYYKEKYTIHNYNVSGTVTGLKHEENDNIGTVTVASMVNGREKHITFELSAEEYWQAHQAHGNAEVIECCGDLYVSPRSAMLVNVAGFRVLTSGNLFDDES
ncbi:hypothetical protein [Thalassolituus pacificus]|uniref:Uncharacterized protein n=1 Tax=Thalassolituus pacificus TaxID=2975440 RepID=A0A9X2WIV2_9GAMM|nr:hypothetical protein [Thalassolituus pacificus]MCT7361043.1 hypothetical protein [Thalassolituus pacificus]